MPNLHNSGTRKTLSEQPVDKPDFAARVLAWFDLHGRKNLPWQKNPSPYRVWVSEIMLQQTQVATVLDYYQRFMARFPDIHALAAAPIDDVLHLWTGLGYYARARNLHRAAQCIVADHGGNFPQTVDALASLPGIGRSTAGAIVALAHNQRATILDGNVKRVLARFHAVGGSKDSATVLKILWQHADTATPTLRVRDYTQAMMDLGATLCTRRKPHCNCCPLANNCLAYVQGNPQNYPERKIAKKQPVRSTIMLLLRDAQGRVLLERRPPAGLWGGLWTFPQCDNDSGVENVLATQNLREHARALLPAFRHTFTHFHLDITPLLVDVRHDRHDRRGNVVREPDATVWVAPAMPGTLGLAAPVVKLLKTLAT